MSDQGFGQQPPNAGQPQPDGPVAPQYPTPPADGGFQAPPPAPVPQPTAPLPQSAPAGSPEPPTQPAPAVQPQPGAYYTPQPQYGPPEGAPQFGPPAALPAKKSRAGLVIGIVGSLLLCGLVSCGVVGLSLYKGGGVDKKSIAQAEQHFSAALSAVEKADTSINSLGANSSAGKVSGVVAETNASLRTARDEVVSAKAIADAWKEAPGKSDYQAGLASASDALDSMQDLVAYLDTASGMIATSKKAAGEANSGLDALNSAISAGNRSSYSKQRSKALSASGHFVKAALLFREAHKLDKSAGLDKAARYCDLRTKQASLLVRMASEGQSHRISAYNSDVRKMNAAGRSAGKVGAPAIVSDTSWADKRLAALGKKVTDAANKADQLRTQALKTLGYTQ